MCYFFTYRALFSGLDNEDSFHEFLKLIFSLIGTFQEGFGEDIHQILDSIITDRYRDNDTL